MDNDDDCDLKTIQPLIQTCIKHASDAQTTYLINKCSFYTCSQYYLYGSTKMNRRLLL